MPFYTISDYLYLLMKISKELDGLGHNAMIYLAAAVSDFYLPEDSLADHKIQSDDGPLMLKLEPVPKMIHAIVELWAPKAFTVSFKLETDAELLVPKAIKSLRLYKHSVVVANMLSERKQRVMLVRLESPIKEITIPASSAEEIEEFLVEELIKMHTADITAQTL